MDKIEDKVLPKELNELVNAETDKQIKDLEGRVEKISTELLHVFEKNNLSPFQAILLMETLTKYISDSVTGNDEEDDQVI